MFYCEPCAAAAEWPTDFWLSRSMGPCEVCGTAAVCFDVSSSRLPEASKDFHARRHAGEKKIQEEP